MRPTDLPRAARIAVLLAGLAALAGCHKGESTTAPAPAKAPPRGSVKTDTDPVADAGRRMAPGVPVGNGTAAVEVRFDLPKPPVAAEAFDVEVAVLPQGPAPVLHIDLLPSEGLAIESLDGPLTVEKVQAGTLARVVVRSRAMKPGTKVLGVKITLDQPGGEETRDFAFPIVIGPVEGAAAPPSATH